MPQTFKVGKTVTWDELRLLIGEKRVDDIITVKYGPRLLGPPRIRLQKPGIEHMLAYLEGRTVEGLKSGYYQAIPATFRAWFQESPSSRRRMIQWLKQKLADKDFEEAAAEGQPLAEVAEQVVTEISQRGKRGPYKKKSKTAVGA